MDNLKDKEYIGDGVYVAHDGFQFWIYTSDGYTVTNSIALEPQVFKSFMGYAKRFTSEKAPE